MKITRILASLVMVASLSLGLVACQKKDSTGAKIQEVNLSIWSNYVTPEMIAAFEKQTGYKVQISNYSSNEELLAKMKAGASGVDVAVPSDYMVFAMAQMDMLEKLDHAKLPVVTDMDPRWMKKDFDPTNAVSLPLDWGMTGIAVNKNLYQGTVKGWNDLFANKALAGKFTLLDDVRETLGAALKANGHSLNSKSVEEVKKAQARLESIRKSVKAFNSETLVGLSEGEMAVAHAYSCDALQARNRTKGKVEFVIPEEGCTLWVDNVVIPKGAKNIEGAYALINFLLSPEISAQRTQNIMVGPTNSKASALLPADLQKDTSLFPSSEQLSKCEMLHDIGESLVAWDHAWTALKASAE